ncbi:YeeE/YedE thiosulfate transporter family protein [Pseudomonas sp. NUPR-001]|uniref:YeeE/YedE thiosulfate transporter family protein n=1 Tax=Pseudomonas sp. NUPR-001 TaxID=3416058 RepID=UPI003F9DF787
MTVLFALILALLIGWTAQRMGLCLVRACELLLQGRPTLFVALLSCGLFGLLLAPLYERLGISQPLFSPGIGYWPLLTGGLLFGVASVLNGGCSLGTLTRITRGDLNLTLTIVGWVLGILLWHRLNRQPEYKIDRLPEISSLHYGLTLGILLLVLLVLVRAHGDRRLVLASMLLGTLTRALYSLEPLWTPSDFFYDLAQWVWTPGQWLISGQRLAVFAALLLGMLGFTVYRKTFRWQAIRLAASSRHLLSGVLMGGGASMMLGGNDSQMLLVFPTLNVVSSLPLLAIVVGILAALGVRRCCRPPT